MRKNELRKVLFGIWVAFSVLWALIFVEGCIDGEPVFEQLTLAACGVVVCQLYWELWHEKAPELHIDIYELPDGQKIRMDWMK